MDTDSYGSPTRPSPMDQPSNQPPPPPAPAKKPYEAPRIVKGRAVETATLFTAMSGMMM
jgi:hypothetical protein